MLFANQFRKCSALAGLTFMCVLLAACSVQTVGQMDQLTDSQLRKIGLPEAATRQEQLLNQALESQIGTLDTDARYMLSYSIASATSSSLSASGSSSSLKNTQMSAHYKLTEAETGTVLTEGSVSAAATSGTITSYYGQEVSGRFAAERLIRLLAERVHQKLQLYFLFAED
ncbi:MAG: hypothetical protein VXW11_02130 [Pseudomonadota bacterium]|nr:hypothetical protein [Pseudomonadota bacterium]